MPKMIQLLQLLSGLAWLVPALVLSPRIVRAWRQGASRATLLTAPIAFVCWLQVGFSIRWMLWPHSVAEMGNSELTCWGALYTLSAGLAAWVFVLARQTKGI